MIASGSARCSPGASTVGLVGLVVNPRLFDSEVYGTETREKLSRYRELAAIPKEERDAEQRREIRSIAREMRSYESLPEQENETSRVLKELMAKYDL